MAREHGSARQLGEAEADTGGRATARQGDHPSNDMYTLKQVLQEHNTTYEIVLCRSQLKQARCLVTRGTACIACRFLKHVKS